MPIQPQKWHFSQSIAYELTANRAVLDVASRYRRNVPLQHLPDGSNSIRRGSSDTWTVTPRKVAALQAAMPRTAPVRRQVTPGVGVAVVVSRRPSRQKWRRTSVSCGIRRRDPRAYNHTRPISRIFSPRRSCQRVIKTGITVERATAPFTVNGKHIRQNSWVVNAARRSGGHVLDNAEAPRDHPNDIPYPGGPPDSAIRNAGWDRSPIKWAYSSPRPGPFSAPLSPWWASRNRGGHASARRGRVCSQSLRDDAFAAVNSSARPRPGSLYARSHRQHQRPDYDAGTFYNPGKPGTLAILSRRGGGKRLEFDPFGTRVSSASSADSTWRVSRYGMQYGGAITGLGRDSSRNSSSFVTGRYPATLDAGIHQANLTSSFFRTA